MPNYSESDLPVDVHHGEIVTLNDGTTIRFESNGEAKNVMLNDDFGPAATLFPGNEFTIQAGGGSYCMTCTFEDSMKIEKI